MDTDFFATIGSDEEIRHLTPSEFEHFAKHILERRGYTDVIVSPKMGTHQTDGGIDLHARHNSNYVIGQCKLRKAGRSTLVPIADIRALGGSMKEKGTSEGVFISNRRYSDQSKIYAMGVGITLLGLDEIIGAMRELNPHFTTQPTLFQQIIIRLDLKRFYRREFLPKMRDLRNMFIALPIVLLLGYVMMHILLFLLPLWGKLMISTLPHISQ